MTKRRSWARGIGLVALVVVWGAGGVRAQQPPAMQQASGPQVLHLLVNRSLVITSPVRIKRLSVANPTVAEAVVISPYQVLVNGKAPGAVSLILWGENGESQTFDLYVDVDVMALSQKIHDVFPSEPVRIEASKDVVMLTGQASSDEVADRIYKLVSAEVPKVISLVQVPTPPTRGQILLDQRQLPFRCPSQSVHFPARCEPGGDYQGARAAQPAADSGRAKPSNRNRQGGQLPGRGRISFSRGAGGCGRHGADGHGAVQGVRRATELHAGAHRGQRD